MEVKVRNFLIAILYLEIPERFLSKYEKNRIHIFENKIVNISEPQKHMVYGYFILIKNLCCRLFLSMDS